MIDELIIHKCSCKWGSTKAASLSTKMSWMQWLLPVRGVFIRFRDLEIWNAGKLAKRGAEKSVNSVFVSWLSVYLWPMWCTDLSRWKQRRTLFVKLILLLSSSLCMCSTWFNLHKCIIICTEAEISRETLFIHTHVAGENGGAWFQ